MAIKVIARIHDFDYSGNNLTCDIEVQSFSNGIVQRTTLSSSALNFNASQIAAGLKNQIIQFMANAPEYHITVVADEILFRNLPG